MNFQSGLFLRHEKLKVLSLFKLNKEKKKTIYNVVNITFVTGIKKRIIGRKININTNSIFMELTIFLLFLYFPNLF